MSFSICKRDFKGVVSIKTLELDSQAIEVHASEVSSLNYLTLFRLPDGMLTGFSSLLSNELLKVCLLTLVSPLYSFNYS